MANRKKTVKEEVTEIEHEDEDDEDDENIIDSSLEIGGQIHIQSNIIKNNFPHLPSDLKYSNFGKMEVINFQMRSKTYSLWSYVNKCSVISKAELNFVKERRKKIYDITTKEQLKNYLKEINKTYIWYSFQQLDPKEFDLKFKELAQQLLEIKQEGIIDVMYNERDIFYKSYDQYKNGKITNEFVDDFGLMNGMMTSVESNKAHKGWAMSSMNTTINVTREENPSEKAEEEPEDSENKGFMKRFKR